MRSRDERHPRAARAGWRTALLAGLALLLALGGVLGPGLAAPAGATATGSAWAWGFNQQGQLGYSTAPENSNGTPQQVGVLAGVTRATAGDYHSLALTGDGTVWAWGDNGAGQLGYSTAPQTKSATPQQVVDLGEVAAIAAGGNHSLALTGDGNVWAWGSNISGQLGDGTTGDPSCKCRKAPVQVKDLTNVAAIAASGSHSLALRGDGTVWTWGYNFYGQLGDGTDFTRMAPVQVKGTGGQGYLGVGGPADKVVAIAAGYTHSLALKADGTVWAWGYNKYGQLGDGTDFTRITPVQVVGPAAVGYLAGATAIAAGNAHSLALKGDGTVLAWGSNTYGQLGDGTAGSNKLSPIKVSGLGGVASVAAGGQHSLAVLKDDGSARAWGRNDLGQLGDGTTGEQSCMCRKAPVQAKGLGNITGLAAGALHSLAVTTPSYTLTLSTAGGGTVGTSPAPA